MDGPQPSPAAAASAPAPPVRSAASAWTRTRALVTLCRLQQHSLLSVRVARALGWVTSFVFAAALGIAATGSSSRHLDSLVVAALTWLSWIAGGLVALLLARNLRSLDAKSGVTGLAVQRGHTPSGVARARTLATMQEVATAVGKPGLVLSAMSLALSPSAAVAVGRSLMLLGVLGYAAGAGILLGGLSRWSAATSPRHGPTLLVTVVLGPHLAQSVWPGVPSVPSWLGTWLDQVLWLGTVAG